MQLLANKSPTVSTAGVSFMNSNSPQMAYFPDSDTVHLTIAEGPESQSVEISPDVTAELNENGDLIGVEILNASSYLRDTLLETVQARLLSLSKRSA
jgi:uncharacterized protein YuzE